MFSDKRLFTGGIACALAVEWILISLVTRNGFVDLFFYLGPAALLTLAVAWLFILGAALVAPLLAYAASATKDPGLMAKFIFMVAVGWAAIFGGTLWNVTGAARDALREWRLDREAQRARRIYVPA